MQCVQNSFKLSCQPASVSRRSRKKNIPSTYEPASKGERDRELGIHWITQIKPTESRHSRSFAVPVSTARGWVNGKLFGDRSNIHTRFIIRTRLYPTYIVLCSCMLCLNLRARALQASGLRTFNAWTTVPFVSRQSRSTKPSECSTNRWTCTFFSII